MSVEIPVRLVNHSTHEKARIGENPGLFQIKIYFLCPDDKLLSISLSYICLLYNKDDPHYAYYITGIILDHLQKKGGAGAKKYCVV